ncbi:MAG: UvrD-helicase domain-containing protein [Saccharospirillaceae bacterium]|nr:UvrD-helicase domain-containing protein [Pseudomonadales bacterium]NRB77872.1 UvrD-helicase domain-containing protein [Saccharospirillaceae bacterium]
MNSPFITPDQQARDNSLDCTTSILCEAPAGSGKTELLTQRYLKLLSMVKRPEEIWAITFTRKAVAEMKERVISALHSANLPKPDEPHKQLSWELAKKALVNNDLFNWQLEKNPNRLSIVTFDSLNSILTQNLPFASGFGANIARDDDSSQLYLSAAKQLIAQLNQKNPPAWSLHLITILKHLDNQYIKLETLLCDFLNTREQWLGKIPIMHEQSNFDDYQSYFEKSFSKVIEAQLSQLQHSASSDIWQTLYENACIGEFNKRVLKDDNIQIEDIYKEYDFSYPFSFKQLNSLKLILDFAFTASLTLRKSLTVKNGFAAGKENKAQKDSAILIIKSLVDYPDLVEQLIEIKTIPDDVYSESQNEIIQAMLHLLPILYAQLIIVFKQNGKVDHQEVSIKARQALGFDDAPTQLAQSLDYQLSHLLIDEFQDTSSAQVDLIKNLTQNWDKASGKTVFCVGDAMQSIYAFRGANVSLFLHTAQSGIGEIKLQKESLTANFRSQQNLVTWFNQCFSNIFPVKNNVAKAAVKYSLADSTKAPIDGLFTKTYLIENQSEHFDPTHLEALHVTYDILDKQKSDPDATFSILVRSKKHLIEVINIFNQQKMDFQALDLVPLNNLPIINDILHLTLSLLHLGNRLNWSGLLQSSLLGLSFPEIEAIEQQKQATVLLSFKSWLAEHPNKKYERFLNTIEQNLKQVLRLPLNQWIEQTWYQLGGSHLQTAQNQEAFQAYITLLQKFEASQIQSEPQILTNAVNALFANSSKPANIQLMTIHKSKGLQFDHVYLIQLQKTGMRDGKQLLLWEERLVDNDSQLLLAPIESSSNPKTASGQYNYISNIKKQKTTLELSRLLYVAATRAKKSLSLYGQSHFDTDKEIWAVPRAGSFFNLLWNEVKQQCVLLNETSDCMSLSNSQISASTSNSEEELIKTQTVLIEDWQSLKIHQQEPLQVYRTQLDDLIEQDGHPFNWPELTNTSYSAHVGTFLHSCLEQIITQGTQSYSEKTFDQRKAFYSVQLFNLGLTTQQVNRALSTCKTSINTLVNSKHIKWIEAQPTKHCEYEISRQFKNKQAKDYILDVFVVDKNNQAWVIDYKSSKNQQDQDEKSFIQQQIETYQAQLDNYAQLIQMLGYKKVKKVLYLIQYDKWVELK